MVTLQPRVKAIAAIRVSLSPIICPLLSSSAYRWPAFWADFDVNGRTASLLVRMLIARTFFSQSFDLCAPCCSSKMLIAVVDKIRFSASNAVMNVIACFLFLKTSISMSVSIIVFYGFQVSQTWSIEALISSASSSLTFHKPAKSEIFFPFLLWRIRLFIASSIETGLLSLTCSSPAIAFNSACFFANFNCFKFSHTSHW